MFVEIEIFSAVLIIFPGLLVTYNKKNRNNYIHKECINNSKLNSININHYSEKKCFLYKFIKLISVNIKVFP